MKKSKISNHARAPKCAEFVESMRECFGEDVKVLYVKENGLILGEPSDDGAGVIHCATCGSMMRNLFVTRCPEVS